MKPANHSALDSLNFSMNSMSLGNRHGPRHSFSDMSFAPIHQGMSSPNPHHARLHHSTSGEHLRSQSAILPDLGGSLDSSFGLLNTPTYGSASFLGLQNYAMLNHSASGPFGPVRSFSVQDHMMNSEMVPEGPSSLTMHSDERAGLVLNPTDATLTLKSGEPGQT